MEVLNKGDFPSGSWRNAEIISGNGRYYNVKYDRSLGDRDVMIAERVPRKAIRPCPPMVVIENWVAGDIVEVFHNNSWKIAKILKAIGGKCFYVTLLGSSQELKVHKFDVRVRQSWQDDQWVVIRKNSGCYEDKQGNKLPAEMHYNNSNYGVMKQAANVKVHAGYHHFPVEDDLNSQCPQGVSARSMKRGSEYCSSHIDTLVESSRKMRALEGKRQQLVSGHPYPLLEKD